MTAPNPNSILEELVTKYDIALQVWPIYSLLNGERIESGFELELIGSHSNDFDHLDPRCRECTRVRTALSLIAKHIVQQKLLSVHLPYSCDILDHSSSILCSSRYGNRPAVNVSINVNFQNGSIKVEGTILSKLKKYLAEFGISEK